MIETKLTVLNSTGLHTRPISQIIKMLSQYESKVSFSVGDIKVENRSPLNFLRLGAKCGTEIKVEIDGSDEEKVLEELEYLFKSKFGEI